MDYVNAFWVGGLICALCQILMEKTKMQPGRIMVLLVCSGAVLGAIGVYPPFVEFAGAGASVPLLGFGNTLFKGIKEAVDTNGFIGQNLIQLTFQFVPLMYHSPVNTCQAHAGPGVDVVTDEIHLHRLQRTKDHKGNDQSVKCDTFCHSYEDNGFTKQ